MRKERFVIGGLALVLLLTYLFYPEKERKDEKVIKDQDMIEVYLLHDHMLVQMESETSKKTIEEKVEEIVSYMKQSHEGFTALLDEKTVLHHVSIKDKVLTYHFDELSYSKEQEARVWEALVYAGTQFDEVDKVNLKIAGNSMKTMPLGHMPLSERTRNLGINQIKTNQIYLHEGKQKTLYYEIDIDGRMYCVPLSIRMKDSNDYNEYLNLMLSNMSSASGIISPLAKEDIILSEECEVKGDVLHLYFNHNALTKSGEVKNKVIKELKKGFSQFEDIHYFTIHVNGKVISVDGKNKIPLGNK